MNLRQTVDVIGTPIDVLDWDTVVGRLADWATEHRSRVVCICNAHSVVTARQDPAFAAVLNAADMATADGAPVAWMLRRQGFRAQRRINGPDLMWRGCGEAANRGIPIYLYGGAPNVLEALREKLQQAFPTLKIAGASAPPFRLLSQSEEQAAVELINASGAGLVWVSLGCPKQERWMHAHRHEVRAVMVGVGAAFDYHAGTLRRAPVWAQDTGLEWLFRLFNEPRRLWRRYLMTNSLFIAAAVAQLVKRRMSGLFNGVPGRR